MDASECAKRVLDWAIRNVVEASTNYTMAECEESARKAGEITWKEYNPDDGVGSFSTNPYSRNKEYNLKRIESFAKNATEAHEVLNFVKDKICQLINQ